MTLNLYKLHDWIHLDNLIWYWLSSNPNAIYLLEQNKHKINWNMLSSNPNAIHLLETHQDKIDWFYLSQNTNALTLLEQNQTLIKTNPR